MPSSRHVVAFVWELNFHSFGFFKRNKSKGWHGWLPEYNAVFLYNSLTFCCIWFFFVKLYGMSMAYSCPRREIKKNVKTKTRVCDIQAFNLIPCFLRMNFFAFFAIFKKIPFRAQLNHIILLIFFVCILFSLPLCWIVNLCGFQMQFEPLFVVGSYKNWNRSDSKGGFVDPPF